MTTLALFPSDPRPSASAIPTAGARALGQYMTPFWLAEAIVQRHYADLPAGALVIEPTCGSGAFLRALPAAVQAIGIELDPFLAERARMHSGRVVLNGDFREHLPRMRADALIGNPPFQAALIDELLSLGRGVLSDGGRFGMILPTYVFQTAGRVVRYSSDWSLAVEMMPRNVFPGLECPLCFVLFRKDRLGHMIGLSFYQEAEEFLGMPERFREKLRESGGVWASVVEDAIRELGGEASLDEIYAHIQPRRPTPNQHWKASVRKVVRERFTPTARARYRLPVAA